MVVRFEKDVFENPPSLHELDHLWSVIEERHQAYLNDEEIINTILQSDWFNDARSSIKESVKNAIVKSIQSGKQEEGITVSKQANVNFSIIEARRYLEQNFQIILEHSINDGYFIDTIIRSFKRKSKKIKRLKEQGLIEYGLGGGSSVEAMIRSKMAIFNGDIFSKPEARYLRCYVIFDSDCKYPDDELEVGKNNLIRFLDENNIPWHMLEKREVENYLPDEAYTGIVGNRGYVDAYLKLDPIQKDYFDIEKGFDGRRFDQLDKKVKDLFEDLTEGDKDVFKKNNLKKINGQNFKAEFPKLFELEYVTQENLLYRCSHHDPDEKKHPYNPNELPDLLTDITKYL